MYRQSCKTSYEIVRFKHVPRDLKGLSSYDIESYGLQQPVENVTALRDEALPFQI